MVVQKSVELSANCLDVRIPFQQSASTISEGPEPPLVFSVTLRTASALIFLVFDQAKGLTQL